MKPCVVKLLFVFGFVGVICGCEKNRSQYEQENPFSNNEVKSFVIFAPYRTAGEFEEQGITSGTAKKLSTISGSREDFWIAMIDTKGNILDYYQMRLRPRATEKMPAVVVFE